MGPSYLTPYKTTGYPVEQFDQLVNSFPPYTSFVTLAPSLRVNSTARAGRSRGGASIGNSIKVNNLLALIDKVDDCILMVHSMSGVTGVEAIKENNKHIKGLIVLEPVGSPTNEDGIKEYFTGIAFLGVYGDYIDQRRQTGRKEAVQKTIDMILSYGGVAEMIDLPAKGIHGNTHLMMQDNNSEEIAMLIKAWISNKVN